MKSFTFETNLKSSLLKNNFIIVLIIVSVLGCFSSCNAVKYVPEEDHMLTKNSVYVNGKKNVDAEITDYIVQRPNTLLLGIPFSLHFHNIGNKNYETDFDVWKETKPGAYKFTVDVFSEKQARGMRDFKWKMNQWWLNNGEAPVLFNQVKTNNTVDNLEIHFYNEGFFNTKVTSTVEKLKNKRATVSYNVETGTAFKIDSISTEIQSPVLDSLYQEKKEESLIKTGGQFRLATFVDEQNRLNELFRNSGVYRFNKNAITFDADSSYIENNADVKLIINDSIGNQPFKIQHIKAIDIYTDFSFNTKDDPIKDSTSFNNVRYVANDRMRYNPKYLSNSLFFEVGDLYTDTNRELTRKSFRSLNNFRSVDIKYTEAENDSLIASIYLLPLKRYSLGLNAELTHSNVRQLGISGRVSFLYRNIFRGAEIMRFSVLGSFLDSKDASDNSKLLNAWEIGADLSLEIPRFLIPISQNKTRLKDITPKTIFTLGTSLQKNIGLDKQKFTGIIENTWRQSRTKNHSFQLINAQFVKNQNIDSYFYIYTSEYNDLKQIQEDYFPDDELTQDNAIEFIDENIDSDFESSNPDEFRTAKNIESRYFIITQNEYVPSIAYTFTYNNSENYKDTNFSFFRSRLVASGNITNWITSNENENGTNLFFNTPISQYAKLDLEYKKFWDFKAENVLAFRSFLGIAIPYGNSTTIPFSRSYFAGGPNDLRAWKTYDVGPGSSRTGLEYNVGNLKFLTSLEYRFEIINSMKGAMFIDAGNIWDITNSELTEPEAKFDGLNSIKDIAIGSGFGIRYDLSFILIRLDLGFKTYEPYLENGNKWFQNYNFKNNVYNFGISYPF